MTAAIQDKSASLNKLKFLEEETDNIIEMYKKTVRALQHHRQGRRWASL